MNIWKIGTAAIALTAIPVYAMGAGGDHHSPGPETRADVEADVKAHFDDVDANKDGVITRQEADAYRDTRHAERRENAFAALDSDNNGQVSKAEFAARHDGEGRGEHRRHGHMAGGKGRFDLFAIADTNQDGKVTLAEATAKRLELFDRADANKDGTVTPEERKAAWKSWAEQRRSKAG